MTDHIALPSVSIDRAQPETLGVGSFVRLRGRRWLAQDTISIEDGIVAARLACIEDDAQGETASIVWDAEISPEIEGDEVWNKIGEGGSDDPAAFAAWVKTITWNSATAADRGLFQAPFRAGIRMDPFQLAPLRKALQLPRVNLLISDDVGLGKTVEAGLVLREMILRRRVDFVVIAAPPSMVLQWKDELAAKFGLDATIVDREHLAQVRRRRGFGANPWATGSCFLISHRLVNDETYVAGLRALLGTTRPRSMLILDEAHHAAPANGSKYATDSQFTRGVRDLAPRFEHRLFLTATPHNGHSNSFSTLLELLNSQRFTRGVPVRKGDLDPVMVRRLKADLRALGERFPERIVEEVTIDDLPADAPDLALPAMLDAYERLRRQRIDALPPREKAEAQLLFSGLQQRLLSSAEAFRKTLLVHRATLERVRTTKVHAPLSAAECFVGQQADDDREDQPEDEENSLRQIDADEKAGVEAATILGTAGATTSQIDAEIAYVEAMAEAARKAALHPDARVRWLVEWTKANVATEGRWNGRRLVIFTEYEDTRRWLDARLKEGLDDLDPDDRIATFTGATSLRRREELKLAFNSEDAETPLRILICTDAAREGINLQKRCYDLVHFDLPWNPSRLEQRNGRIDRKLQPAAQVYCRYFLYGQREIDAVHAALVRKTERIRQELGAIGRVIEDRIVQRLTSSGIGAGQAKRIAEEIEGHADDLLVQQAVQDLDDDALTRRERVKKEIDSLRGMLERSSDRVGIEPADLEKVADVALSRIAPNLRRDSIENVNEVRTFALNPDHPAFATDPSWIRIFDELRERPRKPGQKVNDWRNSTPPRRLSFEPVELADGSEAPHVAQLHVEHRLVKRLLSRFLSQGFRSDLSRACVIAGPGLQPRVLLLGRMSLFGAGAARLHEEVMPVTAIWTEFRDPARPIRPLAEGRHAEDVSLQELEIALRSGRRTTDQVEARLLAGVKEDAALLRPEFERRAEERAAKVAKDLAALGEGEALALRKLLEMQRDRIAKHANDPTARQTVFEFIDEQRQLEADRRHWQKRLTELEKEIVEEPDQLRRSYDVVAQRLEPLGLVYIWPKGA